MNTLKQHGPITLASIRHEYDWSSIFFSRDGMHYYQVEGRQHLEGLVLYTSQANMLTVTTNPHRGPYVQMTRYFASDRLSVEAGITDPSSGYTGQVGKLPLPYPIESVVAVPISARREDGNIAFAYDHLAFHVTHAETIAVISAWLFTQQPPPDMDITPYAQPDMPF